jgi:hypothetical protein
MGMIVNPSRFAVVGGGGADEFEYNPGGGSQGWCALSGFTIHHTNVNTTGQDFELIEFDVIGIVTGAGSNVEWGVYTHSGLGTGPLLATVAPTLVALGDITFTLDTPAFWPSGGSLRLVSRSNGNVDTINPSGVGWFSGTYGAAWPSVDGGQNGGGPGSPKRFRGTLL